MVGAFLTPDFFYLSGFALKSLKINWHDSFNFINIARRARHLKFTNGTMVLKFARKDVKHDF